jgi:hypothetical protein
MDKWKVPPEFEALGYDVDALAEDGRPWSLGVSYENGIEGVVATWSTPFVDGWVLSIDWKLVDDVVQVEELRVHRAGDANAPTAKAVAKLRLGRIYYNVRRLFRWPALGAMLPDAWLRAIERDGLGVPRPGRQPDEELALLVKWAALYADARDRDPRRPVALLVREHPGETPAAIRARLTRARAAGLLTKAGAGIAGGRLTAKARKILKEGK